ncbi:GMP synthase [Theileria orientalis strain Shintoku]|uniref:GMP synthase (glutamine-hydrolyzing) n=1 Tax=Theileria orientalis strain Shintoku TaxID=869250 RepID=J4C7N6_THEOR|nr:GMP synthase [Theileria orientalis strain Shintoku]BAM39353.1 GMP synthase [Theileria orientalis strain Shintoku]|eukprot:XP_009689654.1 GMP synthase [Theileria orientalis strain Shintoku]
MVNDSWALLLDFGCTFSSTLLRAVRELGVRCELESLEKFKGLDPKNLPVGVLLCGGNESVFDDDVLTVDKNLLESFHKHGVPVLCLSFGMMSVAKSLGAKLRKTNENEYVVTKCSLHENALFDGVPNSLKVYLNTLDSLESLPSGFEVIAKHSDSTVGLYNSEYNMYMLYFHPEATDTEKGEKILHNFLYKVCRANKSWTMKNYLEEELKKIKKQCGEDKFVVAGLSGGVDSTVCAKMVHSVIGDRFHGIMIDTGLMRYNEIADCSKRVKKEVPGIKLTVRNSEKVFLAELKGVEDPEEKRKIIGRVYIEEFDKAIKDLGFNEKNCLLLQGTIYPDIIESELNRRTKKPVKSHHNVGGLPEKLQYELIEPVRYLFKQEVRELGRLLNLSEDTFSREPFPGPGLGIRVMASLTAENLHVVRMADKIVREEAAKSKEKVSQALCVYLPTVRSTGLVKGQRVLGGTIVIRCVTTPDFCTAKWTHLEHDILEKMSFRITTEVEGINRVCYDITDKEPSTIEWHRVRKGCKHEINVEKVETN